MVHQQSQDQGLRRRRVFYIPGYDPFPPRRYRELYRRESAQQAAISGYEISQKASGSAGKYGWQVSSTQDGQQVEAVIEVLLWSDIVRASMGRSIAATYLQLVQTAWRYIGSAALFRLMRLRLGPVIAALYPVVALLTQLLLGLLAATAVYGATFWAGEALGLGRHPLALLALLPAGAVLGVILRWFRAHDNRFYAYYLLHDYAFTARWNGAYPATLDSRIQQFADRIAHALHEDWDEVLVIGHSSGAHVAISVLAELDRRAPASDTPLALLTLGHVVPMVSFLPKAERLRGDLHRLAASHRVTWVDVTAMGDGCCFALCDPAGVSGVAPARQTGPLIFSAAFRQSLSEARWKAERRRFFRLHFQYLCAFDRVQDYDYFRITAGPLTLAQRYATRAPSPSRLATPVNRFRSMS
ncbi:hypothetical protein [Thioclava sp. GXIMD4216]|uniref:Alpha/beta hydrolase family protein n=1 Tax=Thioclava litoralis TaxID=3076557 RepID=A0ABZ1E5C8_9RHOB|nr:hypothetical protein RPE78_13250 [Thioclava sp. FTW29]